MATAEGSEGDSADLGAGLVEASVGMASLVVLGVAAVLVEVVVAEVGLLAGSFRDGEEQLGILACTLLMVIEKINQTASPCPISKVLHCPRIFNPDNLTSYT